MKVEMTKENIDAMLKVLLGEKAKIEATNQEKKKEEKEKKEKHKRLEKEKKEKERKNEEEVKKI